jgi:beta-aspartyl-peptidase (threonine type)
MDKRQKLTLGVVVFLVGAILFSFNWWSRAVQRERAEEEARRAAEGARGSGNEARDKEAREAVEAVLQAQVAAWNRGDLEAFMAGYWHSPDLTFFSGKDIRAGWEATLERYQKRYQGEGHEMGKLTFSELRVEVLDPDHAWVRGRWHLETSKEPLGGLFTLIFKKFPEGWRIIHDHTSG